MDYVLFFTILGTGIAIVSFFYGIMINFKNDVNSHIDQMGKRTDLMGKRIDDHIIDYRKDIALMDQRVMETNKRMDGIYHLLLKKLENTKN